MGNCFSDPSHPKTPKGGGQRLGSGPAKPPPPTTTNKPATIGAASPQRYNEPPRVLGGAPGSGGGPTSPGLDGADDEGQRERMRRAAEERAKAASAKGVTSANPKSGQLSAKLAAERKAGPTSPRQQDERLMDRGQWN